MVKLTDDDICARIKIGRRFCRKFAANDRQASYKFRDASTDPMFLPFDEEFDDDDEGGDLPADMAVGIPNQSTTNLITKNAAIAIGDPDFHMKSKTNNPEYSEIAREFLKSKWKQKNYVRLSRKCQLKHDLSGLGIVAFRWDKEYRSCLEFVQSWDLFIDPHTKDFENVEWGGRRIRMSKRKAIEKYGAKHFNAGGNETETPESLDVKPIDIDLYWDREREVHVYDGDVIAESKNLYEQVPLLFYEGEIDPGTSIWPIGDVQLAAGLQAELSDINRIISNRAKHGGPLNLIVMSGLGDGGREAIENPNEQGYVPVKDIVTPPVVRIPGEELSPTLLESKRENKAGMDGLMGVGQYDRGVVDQPAKFATEAAGTMARSTPRKELARTEFERFVTRLAEITVQLEVMFGGPTKGMPTPDEENILWEALDDVMEIRVVEASTAFRDPLFEAQQALQTLTVIAQIVPIMIQTMQPIPNLQTFVDDYLHATGKSDTTNYWLAPMQPMLPPGAGPPGSEGMPGQGQQGVPPEQGAGPPPPVQQ